MTKDNLFNESVWLYENSYGSCVKIKRSWLIGLSTLLLLITPFTNQFILVLPKIFKKDIRIRHNWYKE